MKRDELFPDLLLHDDEELGDALGGHVVDRRLVHRWPLTRTDEVRLADGRHVAYKAQLPPTVETGFYAAARSPLLLPATDLGRQGDTSALAVDWCDAPSLHTLPLDDDAYVALARRAAEEVERIDGDVPIHLDMATPENLADAVDVTAARLDRLIAAHRFDLPAETPRTIRRWATAVSPWLADRPTALCHGDLSAEEVLVLPDGSLRVIDWQRPVRGPVGLDVVSLLRFRGLDPAASVDAQLVQLSWFLLLHWAALVATDVLADLDPGIPSGWARASLGHLLPGR